VNILICRCMEHGGKAMTMLRGMQRSEAPFAEGLGVSPRFHNHPPEIGGQGVKVMTLRNSAGGFRIALRALLLSSNRRASAPA